jgi:hypothetical protein
MASTFGKLALLTLALPLTLAASVARAQEEPCGKFDFSAGINCKIEVSGGCTAHCTPIQFEAGCTGGCNADVTQTCTNDCEATCVQPCLDAGPQNLDCNFGCHSECDETCVTKCNESPSGDDCVTQCKGSCNIHCKSACAAPSTMDCVQHCRECCHGSCDTQVNLECDLQCFARLEGGCKAHCSKPEGALFCNGQYVFASDIKECIAYLATKGIKVDASASASGSVKCGLSGCESDGETKSSVSCSAAPGESSPLGTSGVAAAVAALGLAAARRRVRKVSCK